MSALRRVAIVIGAASGIRKAIALRLSRDGFNVALNNLPRSLGKLKDVTDPASQHCVDAILVPVDVSSESDVEKMVDDTVKRFGGLDAMIANAGIADPEPVMVADMPAEQWDWTLTVHSRCTFLCYKDAARQMVHQGRGGRIVGASSVVGLHSMPYCAHYCAANLQFEA